MKIVLLKSVDNLGTAGDAVEVKRGYFRNYLEPRRMALLATKENMALVEGKREALRAVVARETGDATTLKAQLEALDLHFQLRAGDAGRLFGSVTAREVLEKIKAETGVDIERRKVEMENLKTLGAHDVRIRIYPGVVAKVKVTVERLVTAADLEEAAAAAAPQEAAAAASFFDANNYDDEEE